MREWFLKFSFKQSPTKKYFSRGKKNFDGKLLQILPDNWRLNQISEKLEEQ